MRIIEANFINTIYVSCCGSHTKNNAHLPPPMPRREIADPRKLLLCANNCGSANTWGIYQNELYYKRQHWNKSLQKNNVTEGDFYVLCDSPSMFASVLSTDNVYTWLITYWQTPFLITTSIYHNDITETSWGIVNGKYPSMQCNISDATKSSLQVLIDGRCYTIGNGVTLALAMHRLCRAGIIKGHQFGRDFSGQFNQFVTQADPWKLFQSVGVGSVWETLHYGHPTPHISDFPLFYAYMGPMFVDPKVVDCLLEHGQELELYSMQNGGNNTVTVTSPRSAMLPYHNTSIWNMVSSNYIGSPDIIGVLTAICCNRRSWQWWLVDNRNMLRQWLALGHVTAVFMSTFRLYIHGSDNGSVVRNRIKAIWSQIFDITGSDIYATLTANWQQVLQVSPFAFVETFHKKFSYADVKLLRNISHPYYTHHIKPCISTRLMVLYRLFGMGTKSRETFPYSRVVGQLVLDVFKKDETLGALIT